MKMREALWSAAAKLPLFPPEARFRPLCALALRPARIQKRAMAILVMLGHGQDARGTSQPSASWRKAKR
jgi:hypothetical protein